MLNATFTVTGKDVPFPEGTVTVTGWSGKYDGQPHSISVTTTGIEDPTITYALDAAGPFGATNPSFTTVTNQTVWCVIAADGYISETNSASVVITEGDIGGGGGNEPGPGEVPEGGLSRFDATYVYDGEGHTINTQVLYAVTLAGATPSFSFSLESNGVYQTAPFVYTNVGEYVCWYKIEAANYKTYVHQAKVTIKVPVHEHDGILFDKMLTKDFHGGKLEAGNYFCFEDITLSESVSCSDGVVNICLKGSMLQIGPSLFNCIDVTKGTLEIYDCSFVKRKFTRDGDGAFVLADMTQCNDYEIVGGVIVRNENAESLFTDCGIRISEGAVCKMYGGNIVGFKTDSSGAAVKCNGTFEMYAGSIRGNVGVEYGGGPAGLIRGSWTMFGGEVSDNSTTTQGSGGAFRLDGNALFVQKGGTVSRNSAHFGSVFSVYGETGECATVKIAGGEVCDNESYAANLCDSLTMTCCSFDISGGTISNRVVYSKQTGSGAKYAALPFVNDIRISGDPKIYDTFYWNGFREPLFISGSGENRYKVDACFTDALPTNRLTIAKSQGMSYVDRFELLNTNQWLVANQDGENFSVEVYQHYPMSWDHYSVSIATGSVYTGVAQCPEVKVYEEGVQLKADVNYELKYKNNLNAGVADLEIIGKGYFTGSLTTNFMISARAVTLSSVSESKTYDGTALTNHTVSVSGLGWADGEGATYDVTGSQTAAGSSANAFDYALNEGTKASNYLITKTEGTLTVTKGTVGPGDGEEPGAGDVPEEGKSKFDVTCMYDGDGHTVDTNAIVAAFGGSVVGEFTIKFGRAGSMNPPSGDFIEVALPVWTNVASTLLWYKVTSPNYKDFLHEVKVSITNRPVTLTSGTKTDLVYNGQSHELSVIIISENGFVAGEGITTSNWATVTTVAEGEVANTFDYAPIEGTKLSNYDITVVTGKIAVVAAEIGPGGDEPGTGEIPEGGLSKFDATYVYDGEGHTINTQALYAVTLVGATPSFSFVADVGGQPGGQPLPANGAAWQTEAPAYTNAGRYVVWYRIMAPNYSNYIHSARVTITNKPVRVVSAVAHQRYPWNGLVDLDVTFDGEPGDLAQVECTFAATNGATKTELPITYVSRSGTDMGSGRAWKRRYVWNAAADVGEGEISNVVVSVGAKLLGGVQLWENGPYWAECNVGATKPEEYGYYFWWGDTIGYTREGGTWTDGYYYSNVTWVSSKCDRMSDSPFETFNCLTYHKSYENLQTLGYINSRSNLVTAHDAASVHLGTLWRMPTDAEMGALVNNCTATVTTSNGVKGLLVVGKGKYVTNSIFLPAAGWGFDDILRDTGACGNYWSATSTSSIGDTGSRGVFFRSDGFYWDNCRRDVGQSVRPLREYVNDFGWTPIIQSIFVSTPQFTLSIKNDGIRASSGRESLRYSSLWDGSTNATAKVTLKQGETVIEENLAGEGDYDWNVTRPGLYTLTHTTYTNNAVAKTLTVQFNVSGLPIDPAEIAVTPYDGVYDGAAHGLSVAGPEGTTVKYCAISNGEYEAALTYTDVCATQIWYEVSGGGWLAYTNSAALKISPRAVTVKSQDLSKTYDGTPLTLTAEDITVSLTPMVGALATASPLRTTQPLKTSAANNPLGVNEEGEAENILRSGSESNTARSLLTAGQSALPVGESFVYGDFALRTEAGQTSATFSIAAGANTKLTNYTITPEYGTITITKSATGIGVMANSESWVYDGETHSNRTYTATNLETLLDTDKLVVTFDESCVVKTPQDGPNGDGKVENKITSVKVMRNETEDVTGNYTIGIYPGTLKVTKRPVTVTVVGKTSSVTYDGEEHSVQSYETTTKDELYDIDADTTFGGTAEVKGANAATYKMGLKASDFTNNNECFDVTYDVTDGKLTIAQADISGDACVITLGANPKYNGTVQTIEVKSVVLGGGAAALPVTYDLTGQNATDAGVYTLTVKGTGNFTGEKSTTWSILKRAVTLTSGSATKTYDGTPLMNSRVDVSGDGFVGNEGATYTVTGSQTHVGSRANSFTYALKAGTKAGNYEITEASGVLTVTKADAGDGDIVVTPTDHASGDGKGNVYTFDGAGHGIRVTVTQPADGVLTYAVTAAGPFTDEMPLYTDVVKTSIWYRVTSNDYNPYVGFATLEIVPKTLTEDLCVADEDAAWFFDGEEKKPAVTVVDGDSNIATTNDFILIYSGKTGAGKFPVTVTGTNNYTGMVTKEFSILKRPVAPPIITPMSYNGKKRTPTIPEDSRWTVVANPGGVNAGEYTNVVLRLTNTTDYKWKGYAEDGADTWTGVFVIKKGSNGWSQYPGIASWTYGETPSEPTGRVRYGTLSVAYRVRGAAVGSETSERPSAIGLYTARFWVEATQNYAGVAAREVDFEIKDPNAGDATTTTPVPVPHSWIDKYVAEFGGGNRETAGNATGRNGRPLWESYVAGLDPTDETSLFTAKITMGADGQPVITWEPDLSQNATPRVYTTYGKDAPTDETWTPVTDENKATMKFFKVEVNIE